MKKSTIWILGLVMGLSFLSLLYLQISYIEEMVKMHNEQFDEAVKRALLGVSKNVETAEVTRWLQEDMSEAEKRAYEQSQAKLMETQRFKMTLPHSSMEFQVFSTKPQEVPKTAISRKHGAKTIPQTSRSQTELIKNRYVYQRALVDEVVWQMIYHAKDLPIEKRLNFKHLDQYLNSNSLPSNVAK